MRRPLHGTSTASHFPLLLFLTVAICGPLVPTALAATGPNIVVVLIDDMGWGDFSCYGNTLAKTPNIDRIASQGIRFEQFYVNAPICSPSRCALVTGQYPQRWNIHSYLSNRAENQSRGCADWLDPRAPAKRLCNRTLWQMASWRSTQRRRCTRNYVLRI
jgi:uncharacterized sulfatase